MGENLLKEIEKGSKMAVMKKKIITHYIYNGSSTITDLAREMDLSVPTVTKFIDEMCEEGYINDYGKLETSGGRHPSLYGLNADSGYFVGVEVRQFSINLGLINFKGDVVQLKMNVPFKAKNTPESLDELCKLIKHFLQKVSVEKDKILNRIAANLCLKNINDKHSPTKGINVIITDKITIKAKEIAQCRELVSILYILLFINITNSYFIG